MMDYLKYIIIAVLIALGIYLFMKRDEMMNYFGAGAAPQPQMMMEEIDVEAIPEKAGMDMDR